MVPVGEKSPRLVEVERRQHLRLEDAGAAAIVAQRHQRVQRVEIALEAAEIGLERPERGEHAAAHAEPLFDLVENDCVLLELLAAD